MKTQMKKLASILLALGMVLSLGSCGKSGTDENSGASKTGSDAEVSAGGAEAPVSGDIVFQTWTTETKEVVDLQVEAMKEIYPDLNIKMELFSYNDYWQKLPIAIASGAGPDMYLMTRPNLEVFANAGQTADITSYMTSSEALKKNASEVDAAIIETYQVDGKQMGYPLSYESTGIIFNKDIFEKAGVPLPSEIEDTWTWDDLREMAKTLTKREGDKITQYGYYVPAGRFPTFEFIWANGGELFNEDGTRCVIASEEGKEAIQFLADMMLVDQVSPTIAYTQSESSTDMFLSGKIAMMSLMNSSISNMINDIKDFEWDVAEMPLNPKTGKRYASSNVLGYIINPNSKNIDACIAYLAFITSAEQQSLFAEKHVYIPANKNAQAAYFESDVPANLHAFERALSYAKPMVMSGYVPYAQTTNVITEALTNIYNGTYSVEEAWTDAQNQLNEVIDEKIK